MTTNQKGATVVDIYDINNWLKTELKLVKQYIAEIAKYEGEV